MTLERASRWAVIVIAAVALFGALRAGVGVFAPLAFGLVLGVVLSPVSDLVDRLGLPRTIGALFSLFLTLVVVAGLAVFFEPRIRAAFEQAPRIMAEFQDIIDGVQDMLRGLDEVQETVEEAIQEDPAAPEPTPVEVVGDETSDEAVNVPQITDALWLAPGFAAQALVVIGVFFFFLVARHGIYEWVARRRDGISDGPTAKTLIDAERAVSRYFLTISLINIGLGVVVAVTMQVIGLPSPYLWGMVATLLNFILYIGPAVVAMGLLIAGVVAFDGAMSFVPPLIYVACNTTEGQFVTPALVGRNLSVNPLLVFLSLVFWLWLWGPIGGIVAIPILLYVLAIVAGFGVSQTISFGTPGRSRPNRSAGAGS